MLARKLGAALAAGCTTVVKPAGETPLTAMAMSMLAMRAGIPAGVINVVNALQNTPEVGLTLCESNDVRKLSFTGSVQVGKLLMRQCSDSLKKLSFELGGNAPFIVFDDANIEDAVAGLVASKFKVTGQTCVCTNRIYVQHSIMDQFCRRLVEAVSRFRVGNGFAPDVTHGPLISRKAVAKVSEHVRDAKAKGAKVLIGGDTLSGFGMHNNAGKMKS